MSQEKPEDDEKEGGDESLEGAREEEGSEGENGLGESVSVQKPSELRVVEATGKSGHRERTLHQREEGERGGDEESSENQGISAEGEISGEGSEEGEEGCAGPDEAAEGAMSKGAEEGGRASVVIGERGFFCRHQEAGGGEEAGGDEDRVRDGGREAEGYSEDAAGGGGEGAGEADGAEVCGVGGEAGALVE